MKLSLVRSRPWTVLSKNPEVLTCNRSCRSSCLSEGEDQSAITGSIGEVELNERYGFIPGDFIGEVIFDGFDYLTPVDHSIFIGVISNAQVGDSVGVVCLTIAGHDPNPDERQVGAEIDLSSRRSSVCVRDCDIVFVEEQEGRVVVIGGRQCDPRTDQPPRCTRFDKARTAG